MSPVSNYQLKFGKHANKPLSEVPNDYLVYIINKNENLYDSVKEKIKAYLDEQGVDIQMKMPSGSEYVMKFGKFKNKMLKEIDDIDYLNWCINSDKVVDGVKHHIRKHLESIV
jgi:uncharacterized protein (DUF3820 family)